jgi:arsenate reductase-like glutaredoxin family protein
VRALLDEQSRAFREGLRYMRMDDAELFERLLTDQRLIRLPLVRHANEVAIGADERRWKELLSAS